MLNRGDKIGLVACSNALPQSDEKQIAQLMETLKSLSFTPVRSSCMTAENSAFSGTAKERAKALMRFYADDSIKAIFDISGGDVANGILGFLDYGLIRSHPKPFWGYSDLTTVINAIYQKTGNPSCLYQIRNLIGNSRDIQMREFQNTVLCQQNDLNEISWRFFRGSKMEGVVIGGNIRCFLKLAGTPYLPDFHGKLLFLESRSGGAAQMAAYFYQLKQMGAFEQIAGLLLGTFTQMEEQNESPSVLDLIAEAADHPSLPVAKTQDVGHSSASKCLVIGKTYCIEAG